MEKYPFNENEIMNNSKNFFYQFKTNSKLLLFQDDDWNCRLGTIFTIMRIARAFEYNKVSKSWIDNTEYIHRVYIPSSMFYSIKYRTTNGDLL